jgi:hypothetical protein
MRPRRVVPGSLALLVSIILAAVLVAIGGVEAGANGGRPFTVVLSGDQEVAPAIGDKATTPGVDGVAGSGVATLALNPGQQGVCYSFEVADIQLPASMAHIHRGPAGANGPIVVHFDPPGLDGTSGDCVAVDRALVKEIIQHPERFYVNVHTPEFGGGALRGQISK